MAATHNCVEIARMLIEAGTQLRCKDNEELTPLHCAAMEGNIEIVQLLFQAGAKQDGWVTISNVSMADYLVSSLNHMYSKKNLPGLKDHLLTLYYVSFAWWYCLLLSAVFCEYDVGDEHYWCSVFWLALDGHWQGLWSEHLSAPGGGERTLRRGQTLSGQAVWRQHPQQ